MGTTASEPQPPPEGIATRAPEGGQETEPSRPRLMQLWPGRTVLRSLQAFTRVELFDRSMTVAAQLFTSIFPILILLAT